jgi:hypothetical protein
VDSPYGEQIVVVDRAHFVGAERQQRLGASGRSHELNFRLRGDVHVDDGAQVTGAQPGTGSVVSQDDCVDQCGPTSGGKRRCAIELVAAGRYLSAL